MYDLYTYLWDMCGVVQTLDGFVQWMSKGSVSPKLQNYVVGQQTWFSGIREAFSSGDHEPWMFRGKCKIIGPLEASKSNFYCICLFSHRACLHLIDVLVHNNKT